MKLSLVFATVFFTTICCSQSLTVEKIMQDPKWIGTSPSTIYWGPDSKTIYFSWNPDKNISDSTYKYIVGAKFVMANPAITSDVVGVSSIKQMNEVVCTDEYEKLTESDMEILRNALRAKL